jgi:ethanolamine utilization protein EutN
MNLGRVTGSLWATQKYDSLEGQRMLIVQPLTFSGEHSGRPLIALDTMDAGPGDTVIFATSSEAAIPFHPTLVPTDATIVGIVERVDHVSGSRRTVDDQR